MSASVRGRPRVAFVTNVAAPYRRPVWRAMAQRCELSVVLLVPDQRLHKDERNRGDDWQRSTTGDEFYRSVRTVSFRFKQAALIVGVGGLVDVVRSSDCLVLGGWESPVYWQLRLLALLFRRRCVGFYESTRQSRSMGARFVDLARRLYFSSLRAVVVPGQAAQQNLLALGIPAGRIVVGRNAVDVHAIAAAVARARAQRAPAPAGALLSLGQLVARKNISLAVDATVALDGAVTLTVAGEGPERAELERRAAAADRSWAPRFLSNVDSSEVPGLLAQHSTLLLLSSQEVWGLVVNEALAAGLHVIVSRACGVAASVEGMRGVWIVEPELDAVVAAVRESVRAWTGPIPSPEAMAWTPEALAGTFLSAVERALSGSLAPARGDQDERPGELDISPRGPIGPGYREGGR